MHDRASNPTSRRQIQSRTRCRGPRSTMLTMTRDHAPTSDGRQAPSDRLATADEAVTSDDDRQGNRRDEQRTFRGATTRNMAIASGSELSRMQTSQSRLRNLAYHAFRRRTTISHAYGNGHGGDFRRGRTAGRGPAAGVGRTSGICTAALPTWSPASKRGMAGRSAESGGLRARWWRRRWPRSCPGPLVVVAPHPGEIDAIARDLALFSDLPVAEFPAWEAEPGERVVHDEIYGERLRVLKALAGCEDARMPGSEGMALRLRAPRSSHPASRILVTSIQSLLQPVPGRDALAAATREIRVGGAAR